MQVIRWGILGLGKIANKFASDLLLVEHTKLTAVASTNLDRAKSFALCYGSDKFYGSYNELFEDTSVDIIYIASLHPQHASLSIKSLLNGKAVLCEKPLAMNAIQVEEMIAISKEKNIFLMEALWTRFNPAFCQAKKWIDEGSLGSIHYINATFSFNGSHKDEDSRLFNPIKGGGTLLDIGIYPIFLAYYLLGIPKDIKASAHLTSKGVDKQLAIILTYDHAHAILYSSFTHNEDMRATIAGENGEIYIDDRWHESPTLNLVQSKVKTPKFFKFLGLGYSYEIMEANQCLREGIIESSKWSHQNSLELIKIIDSIRKIVGISYPSNI
jgi:predicted dehydrogenase